MRKLNLDFNLSVIMLKEGKRFVAYAPALDLSTSGTTFAQAKKRFTEAAMLFFEEIFAARTANEVLGNLGWQRKDRKWQAPIVVANDSETIRVPVAAA